MFREMRKINRLLPQEDAVQTLADATSGVLCVMGVEGYPYGVPVSHVYHDGKLYFHCADTGHKLDAIRQNGKVSFTVIAKDDVKPEEFTTKYRSAIAFGRARILESHDEKRAAMKLLLEKFTPAPELMAEGMRRMEEGMDHTAMVEIVIDHISGKAPQGSAC